MGWVCLSHQGARLRGGRTVLVTRPGAVLKVARRGVCTESSTGDSPAGGVPGPFGYCGADSPWKRRVLSCGRPSKGRRQLPSSPAATRSKYGRTVVFAASFIHRSESITPSRRCRRVFFVVGSAVTSRIFERSKIQVWYDDASEEAQAALTCKKLRYRDSPSQ